MKKPKPTTSADFNIERFGILNASGDFWTPDTFDSVEDAKAHIVNFWGMNNDAASKCLKTHKIIPVIVTVSACPKWIEGGGQ